MVEPQKPTPAITNLSPVEYTNQPAPPLLIDVRSALEYQLTHPIQAVNLSLPRLLLGALPITRQWVWPQWFQTLSSERPLAVICLTAHRSPIAASFLGTLGFTAIQNISGGLVEWKKQGLPTGKGANSNA